MYIVNELDSLIKKKKQDTESVSLKSLITNN